MNLIEDLKWRYAAKRLNNEKVSQDKIDRILEVINLAPTSLGLQAFKIFVIENQELKDKIFAEACQQPQTKECSHLLVFAPYISLEKGDIDEFLTLTAKSRNMEQIWVDKYRDTINYFVDKNKDNLKNWLAHQVYIALGFACVAAANERVDSVPIEGFDSVALDKILGLEEKGLSSSLLLPLGYRDAENDPLASMPKARKNILELVEIIA